MLALPGAAVGAKDRFSASWKATDGNWLRLFAIALLTLLPLHGPFIIITGIVRATNLMRPIMLDADTPQQAYARIIVFSISQTIDLAVLTVMLSLTYDILVRRTPVPEQPV